jgi:hypothetical protein
MHFLSLITLSLVLQPIWCLVTLQTIRNLTALTDESKERIVESGTVVVDQLARVLGGQLVLGGGDEEEVEDVSIDFFLESTAV